MRSYHFGSKLNFSFLSLVFLFTLITIFSFSVFAASGDLDPTFGNGGKIITPLGEISTDIANTAALQSDGKIVLGGRTTGGILITRVNSDGSLDTSFSINGIATKNVKNYLSNPRVDTSSPTITALTIQPDGKILMAGSLSVFGDTIVTTQTFFARLNTDGSFDNSFGTEGVRLTIQSASITSMYVQSNGKIVIPLDSTIFFWVLRLNPDGSTDTSFGDENNGILKIQTGLSARGFGITSQSDGKLILSGRDINGLVIVRLNVDGSYDTTFDGDGKVFTTIPNIDVRPYSVSVQADGKIVAIGNSVDGNGNEANGNVALAVRYNSDGLLDTTFASDGIFTSPIGTGINRIYSSKIQPDGKILFGGESSDIGGFYNFTVVRLNFDGSFDNTFNTNGIIRLPLGTSDARNRSVLLQADGKIVLAGYAKFLDNTDLALTRFNSDGSLDTTFDDDGISNIELKNSTDFIQNIAIQADGKIVAGLFIYEEIRNKFILKRYNTDGTLDTTFGNSGTTTTTFNLDRLYQSDLAIQPDGKIIVVGSVSTGSSQTSIAARYNSDGSLDSSFGSNGITPQFENSSGYTVTLQNDGKIVIGGSTESPNFNVDFNVLRLNPNGSLDTTFGNNGTVSTDFSMNFGNSFDFVQDIKIQADGKIVAVGEVQSPTIVPFSTITFFAVARYNSDGSLDPTFDTDGILGTNVENANGGASLVEIQNDGKILIGGTVDSAPVDNYKNFGLVRLNPDGNLDTSFDEDGMVLTQTGNHSQLNDFKILPDGKIIAAGSSLINNDNSDLTTIRYNSDGSLDSTYGSGGKCIIDINGYDDSIRAIAIQSDGKMIGGGSASNQLNADTLLARFILNAPSQVPFDFDADGKSDISVFRPSEGNWYLLNSTEGFSVTHWGNSLDKIAPADFNGDGTTDFAVFRPSQGFWYILEKGPGTQSFRSINFGMDGDIPVPADFDGNGSAEVAVFRPSEGKWHFWTNGLITTVNFGLNGDVPVAGDFDGDGKSDIAVFRPSSGIWYILQSSDGQVKIVQFGIAEDKPVLGDFDGDRKTDISVWRPSTGIWYRINSSDDQTFIYKFGATGDIPSVGDFDGDGKSDITVFRPSNGVWYRLNSNDDQFDFTQFGLNGDKPIPAYYVP